MVTLCAPKVITSNKAIAIKTNLFIGIYFKVCCNIIILRNICNSSSQHRPIPSSSAKHPCTTLKTWTKYSSRAKHPGKALKTWTKYSTSTKYPHTALKTWTKYSFNAKHPRTVLKTWTKYSFNAKHPRRGPRTWRKCTSNAKYPRRGPRTWRKCPTCTKKGSRKGLPSLFICREEISCSLPEDPQLRSLSPPKSLRS